MSELLPCPFCGGADVIIDDYATVDDEIAEGCALCKSCEAAGPIVSAMLVSGEHYALAPGEQVAVAIAEKWNTRRPAPVAGEREALSLTKQQILNIAALHDFDPDLGEKLLRFARAIEFQAQARTARAAAEQGSAT
jgi:Lar family restriction alleviation protein